MLYSQEADGQGVPLAAFQRACAKNPQLLSPFARIFGNGYDKAQVAICKHRLCHIHQRALSRTTAPHQIHEERTDRQPMLATLVRIKQMLHSDKKGMLARFRQRRRSLAPVVQGGKEVDVSNLQTQQLEVSAPDATCSCLANCPHTCPSPPCSSYSRCSWHNCDARCEHFRLAPPLTSPNPPRQPPLTARLPAAATNCSPAATRKRQAPTLQLQLPSCSVTPSLPI